jgi:hypothetical protein
MASLAVFWPPRPHLSLPTRKPPPISTKTARTSSLTPSPDPTYLSTDDAVSKHGVVGRFFVPRPHLPLPPRKPPPISTKTPRTPSLTRSPDPTDLNTNNAVFWHGVVGRSFVLPTPSPCLPPETTCRSRPSRHASAQNSTHVFALPQRPRRHVESWHRGPSFSFFSRLTSSLPRNHIQSHSPRLPFTPNDVGGPVPVRNEWHRMYTGTYSLIFPSFNFSEFFFRFINDFLNRF